MEELPIGPYPCKEGNGYKDKGGYYKTSDHVNNHQHRDTYIKYHGAKLGRMDLVRHRCNNPGCIEITHLVVGTYKDNMRDCINADRHGARAKLDWSDVEDIRRQYKYKTQRELAVMYNVSRTHIARIVSGSRWSK